MEVKETKKCGQDIKFKDSNLQIISQSSRSRLLQISGDQGANQNNPPTWHQLRIFIDYSFAEEYSKASRSIVSKYKLALITSDNVKKYFLRITQVNYRNILNFVGETCFIVKVLSFQKQADLYLVTSTENEPQTEYSVAVSLCFLSDIDERPILGALIINYAFITNTAIKEYVYFSTFAHEITRMLGFSSNLYTRYRIPGTNITRSDVAKDMTVSTERFDVVIMPEVLSYAKTFFKCSTLEGMPLENNGGSGIAGSHWEKLFLAGST